MAEAELTADMVRYQYHSLVREAVDDFAPHHLNKKGRWGWAARALGIGYDRARKAYQRQIRRVEHHEFVSLSERFAALLKQQEQQLAQRLEQHRVTLDRWEQDRAARAMGRSLSD